MTRESRTAPANTITLLTAKYYSDQMQMLLLCVNHPTGFHYESNHGSKTRVSCLSLGANILHYNQLKSITPYLSGGNIKYLNTYIRLFFWSIFRHVYDSSVAITFFPFGVFVVSISWTFDRCTGSCRNAPDIPVFIVGFLEPSLSDGVLVPFIGPPTKVYLFIVKYSAPDRYKHKPR